jgi:hypothetical protein
MWLTGRLMPDFSLAREASSSSPLPQVLGSGSVMVNSDAADGLGECKRLVNSND